MMHVGLEPPPLPPQKVFYIFWQQQGIPPQNIMYFIMLSFGSCNIHVLYIVR